MTVRIPCEVPHRGGFRATPILLLMLTMLAACGNQTTAGTSSETATTAATTTGMVAAVVAAPTTGTSGAKLKVIATFSILGDLVQNVGGDVIELRMLVPADSDTHTFEPSPADSVAMVEAALIFENSLAFERWLPEFYEASRSKARRVVVTEGIEPLTAKEGSQEEEQEERSEYDPHIWHDVNHAIVMVEHIRDALVQADPPNAAAYERNAAAYLDELRALDAYVVEQAATLPAEQRKLVTTHDTFEYFARRYGFEVVGTALGAASTEVADPSAATLARLVDQIKATGVRAIFAENTENSDLMQRVANEAGVDLGPPLLTDALGAPGSDGDTYLRLIQYNIEAMVRALGA